MTQILRYYNLHNLVNIKLISEWPRAIDLVDKHYSSFRTDRLERVDLDVKVGDFEPELGNCTVIDDKYYVKDDSLFCRDAHKISRWKVWIQHLEGNTSIAFTGDPVFSYLFLFKFILEPIVFFKLVRKGLAFLHSSCVGDGRRAYILVASKGVGKTTSALRLANQGMQFFSDEYTILSKDGVVYSYPNCIHLHSYNLKDLPFLKETLAFKDRTIIGLKGSIYKFSLGYANLAHNIEIKNIMPGLVLGTTCPLGGVILLSKTTAARPEIKKIDPEDLKRRIIAITNFEMPQFVNYVAAFSAVNSRSATARHWDQFASDLDGLASVPCYEIRMSPQTREDNFSTIASLLTEIRKESKQPV